MMAEAERRITMNRLAGKAILITGAAAGIGRAAAMQAAREGARLAIVDIALNGAEETAAQIRAGGGEALAIAADVRDSGQVQAAIASTVTAYGRLDGAVNNAGVSGSLAFSAEMDEDDWQHTLDVNLSGVFRCLKYELRQMMAQAGGGAIVNTASAAGLIGLPRAVAYTASKHGVIGITRTAALEYARRGIRVNAVCPGFVETAMVGVWEELRPGMLAGVRQFNPMRRLGQPREVAEAIVWLLSDEASFVNGHTLSVDGGVTAQ